MRCFIRQICLLLLALAVLSPASAARLPEDEKAYPASYFHANYREYVDLASCAFSEDDAFEKYTTGFIASTEENGQNYRTRSFRLGKDSGKLEFYDSISQGWIAIPRYRRAEVNRYKEEQGYMGYIEHYHPFEYFMFKVVYRATRGKAYPDDLKGERP